MEKHIVNDNAMNQTVREKCTLSFTLTKQPNFSFRVSLYTIIDRQIFDARSDKQTFVIDYAFMKLRIKQLIASDNMDGTNTVSKYIEASENLEVNGSICWIYERMAIVSFYFFYEDMIKRISSLLNFLKTIY